MASVQLRKSDKIHALNNMVRAKYQERYNKLIKRRAALTERVYHDTFGRVGEKLKAATPQWQTWCETRDSLRLPAMPVPGILAEPTTKLRRNYYKWELFSERQEHEPMSSSYFSQQLSATVVWPRNAFHPNVSLDKASTNTKKVAGTLKRDIERFNREAKAFYEECYNVLMHIRSTKKVDEMFPELWNYLPTGMRERIKQAVVPLTQEEVDRVRKQLPKG